MRTITLSGSVWLARDSVPPLSPKPQAHAKPLVACCWVSLKSKNRFSKLFLRTPNHCASISSSRQWSVNTLEERFRRFIQISEDSDVHRESLRYIDGNNGREILESTQIMDACIELNEAMAKNLGTIPRKAIDFLFSDHSVGRYLKLMMLFGCLTLQVSEPAFAASDFSIPYLQDLGDISTGFASAFLLIFFSELGDKTFFIAALLAARNSAAVVFMGTFGALAAMTIISVALGRTFHYVDEILPFSFGGNDLPLDDIAAVLLLVYFGVSTLLDASSSDGLKAEDEQKEAELAVSEFSGNGTGIVAAANTVISTFFLVFVAEWGDKSFFSTIALAAASSPLGVIAGSLAGHGVATLLAVLGGSLLGSFLSEKAIAYIGGVLFLVFAAITLVEIVN